MSNNPNLERSIKSTLKKIMDIERSREPVYIFRGENKKYKKVSSSLYREYCTTEIDTKLAKKSCEEGFKEASSGNRAKAIENFKEALKLDPNISERYNGKSNNGVPLPIVTTKTFLLQK